MAISLTPEQLEGYKRGARARLAREEAETWQRRETAWQVARRAAELLCERYGARRVVVFGSLAAGPRFGPASDIDLAVEGIAADHFWAAWAALDYIDSPFEIDLVALEFAPPKIIHAIERDGVEL